MHECGRSNCLLRVVLPHCELAPRAAGSEGEKTKTAPERNLSQQKSRHCTKEIRCTHTKCAHGWMNVLEPLPVILVFPCLLLAAPTTRQEA